MCRDYEHIAIHVLRPCGRSEHSINQTITLANQVFHEPIGDAEFGPGSSIKHCRRQPRGLQIQIDNQNPIPFARQVPSQNGRGGAAPEHLP